MKTYEQVEQYMQQVGLKYIKSSNDFIAGLMMKTDKEYTTKLASELNARGTGQSVSNAVFYRMKNESLDASIFVSAAFDGGLFRHLGNMIIDNSDLFGGKIIDFGCDCGIVTCFIAKMYPDCNIVGVDVNELAVKNAKLLAEKLGLKNVSFVTSSVFEYNDNEKADTVCSFRGLLDICYEETKALPFFGERESRENMYARAFSNYALAISGSLKDGGRLVSVERYTADYGWLGWMKALESHSLSFQSDRCSVMRASDINSVKEYSVTFAQKSSGDSSADTYNIVLSRDFKSGTGYDGYMAEFALYFDSEGEVEFFDVFEGEKIIHQFALAQSKNGKVMYYDAGSNKKKIKYANPKKKDNIVKQINDNLSLYSNEKFTINKFSRIFTQS